MGSTKHIDTVSTTGDLTLAGGNTITVLPSDYMTHDPLTVTKNGVEVDVFDELERLTNTLNVMIEITDRLLENARLDESVAEILDKHEMIRKLAK